MAESGRPSIHVNVFVKEQNHSTQIERCNIENLALDENHQGPNKADTRSQPTIRTGRNQNIIGTEDPKSVSWISENLVMFNKQRVSPSPDAKVYRGRQELSSGCFRDVAIKLIPHNEVNRNELEILAKLNHPNIVQIYQAGECNALGHWIYIVMELCPMNLERFVNENLLDDPAKAFQIFKQLVDAVGFMHKKGIAHRDIKPNNILISQTGDSIKFSDFGISKEIPEGLTSVTDTSHGAGTEGFKPPELYVQGSKVRLSSDIFSLGLVTAYLFANGKHPFGDDPHEWTYKIKNNIGLDLSKIPQGLYGRPQLVNLINRMLQPSPDRRPTIHEISKDALFSVIATPLAPQTAGLATAKPVDKMPSQQVVKPTDADINPTRQLRNVDIEQTEASFPKDDVEQRYGIALFDEFSHHMHCFDPQRNTVSKMHEYHDDMKQFQFNVVCLGNCIYVFMPNNKIFCLDYSKPENTWKAKMSFSTPHQNMAPVVAADGKLFVIATKSVFAYTPSTDAWQEIQVKRSATIQCAIVAVDGFIYCIGGSMKNVATNMVERMNLERFTWEQLDRMPHRLRCASAVQNRRKIFVMGGFKFEKPSNSLDMFDPQSGQWSTLRSMNKTRYHLSSYAVNDRIYIPDSRVGQVLTLAEYNIKDNEWRIIRIPEEMLHISASTAIDVKI